MAPSRIVFALLAAFSAGCAQGEDIVVTPATPSGPSIATTTTTGSDVDPPISRMSITPAVEPFSTLLITIDHEGIEPTIGVNARGTLFLAASGDANDYLRSLDGGATWMSVMPATDDPMTSSSPFQSQDPFVHVDRDTGRVFALDMYGLQCSWLIVSDDEGESWTANPLACGAPPGFFDHPSLTTSRPRGPLSPEVYANLVVLCANHPNLASSCAISLDGGMRFGAAVPVFAGVAPSAAVPEPGRAVVCGGPTGHVAASPSGVLYLPKGHCGVPMVGVSVDGGLTWTTSTIATDVGSQSHEVRVAIDADDNVHALWMGNDGLPYLSSSDDTGATWTKPRAIAPQGVTATDFPAIVAGAAGRVAVAFLGTSVPGGYLPLPPYTDGVLATLGVGTGAYETAPEDATWYAYLGVLEDARSDAEPLYANVTADDPLARGQCGRMRCPGVMDFIGMTVDAEGRPWVGLVDACRLECATDPSAPSSEREEWKLMVATVAEGPSLLGGRLGPLALR